MYTLYAYILQTYNVIHSRSFSQFSVKRYIQCCNFIQFTHFHVQDDLLRSLFKAACRLTLRPRWVRPQCNHQPPRLQWKLSCPTRRAPPQNQQILLPPWPQSLVCEVGSFWKSKCLHHWSVLPSFLGQLLWGLVWFFDQWIVAWFHECPYAVCVKKDLPLNDLMWGDKHVVERSTIGLPHDVECFMTMVAMCNEHMIQAPTATAGRPSIKNSSQRFKCFVSNGYVGEVVWVYG